MDPVSCAPLAPLTALTSSLGTLNAQLLSAPQFKAPSQSALSLHSQTFGGKQQQPTPQQQQDHIARTLIQSYDAHQQPHVQQPHTAEWTAQFSQQQHEAAMRYQMALHQRAHMQTPPVQSQWAAEFAMHAHAHAHAHAQAQSQGHSHSQSVAATHLASMPMIRPLNAMSIMTPQHYMQQSYMPSLMSYQMPVSIPQSSINITEIKDGDSGMTEAIRKEAEIAAQQPFVNEFVNQADVAQPQQQSLGGGLDAEMLDRLMNSDDPKWRNSKFLKFISKIRNGQIEFVDNEAVERPERKLDTDGTQASSWADEYERDLSDESLAREWAADSDQRNGFAPLSDADALAQMSEAERAMMQGMNEDSWSDAADDYHDDDWQRQLNSIEREQKNPEYTFSTDAPLTGDPTEAQRAFEEGQALFQSGQLQAAIERLETAVRLDAEHADAWCVLGQAHAENESETNAIAALLKAVSIDPYNLTALMMLGVSYTNDLEENRALNYLKTWLLNNPDYHSTISTMTSSLHEYENFYGAQDERTADQTLHNEVTKLFRQAVTAHPNDVELHQVMGVLYHISSDYDLAIESFKAALKLNPSDARLWNKLGATQANSSRSADAVHAYQRALQLRPQYVRALANLAISYANQNMHEAAVQTYLKTLTFNSNADHIWSYLRISLSHLTNPQFVELAQQKNVELFRPYFQF